MKKIIISIIMVSSAFYGRTEAQVGINNISPTSTLDITAKNPTGATNNVDGILVPRVDRQRAQNMTAIPTSTMIYVNNIATGTAAGIAVNIDAVGYYFYDGAAWTKMPVNIYNSNGTLTGNRTVTQGANTLAFSGNAVNAFSVAGSTFSVDAANSRVGIGTAAPNGQLELGQTTANRKLVLYGSFNNDNQFYGFGVNSGILRYQADVTGTDHVFYAGTSATTSNELMRIKGTGNVGIGTSAPEVRLQVVSPTSVSNRFNLFDAPAAASGSVILALRNTSALAASNQALIGFTNSGTTSGGANWGIGSIRTGATAVNGTEEDFFFGNSLGGNYLERVRIKSSGQVAIGTSTPSAKLTVSGSSGAMLSLTNTNVAGNPSLNIYPGYTSNGAIITEGNQYGVVFDQDPGTTGGATIGLFDFHGQIRSIASSNFSDRRLKKDIKDLNEYGITEVMKLQPRRYIMKEHNNPDIGFIAQELKMVIPEIVYGDESKGMLSVDYSKVSLVLVNAIKEQQKLIEEQSKQIKALQADVQALKAKK